MTGPDRKRKRQALSCILCRRRKLKCDRAQPCSNCLRSRNGTCVYETQHGSTETEQSLCKKASTSFPPLDSHHTSPSASILSAGQPGPALHRLADSRVSSSTTTATPRSQDDGGYAYVASSKAQTSEEESSKAPHVSSQSSYPTPNSRAEAAAGLPFKFFDEQSGNMIIGDCRTIKRGVIHKTRLYGQSHWSFGIILYRETLERIEPMMRSDSSRISLALSRCKYLAHVIKSRRMPSWPTPLTAELPPKALADELVDCYLRTSEPFYRTLHIPTFKKDYEALWQPDSKPDMAFLVQVKLVFAIGSASYDDMYTLRESATRWLYEAYTWLCEPVFKQRLNIQVLQASILLLLAREAVGIGEDLVWSSVGALLRKAVYMGLHRDPACLPTKTTFVAEMRRRLWNTIIELDLQSSLTSGGPPLISTDDYDAASPGNFDDDQIENDGATPKPENCFTQMSITIALRKSYGLRLSIAKILNDLAALGSYEDTLRLDSSLRAAYKIICRKMQKFRSEPGPSPTQFEMSMVDFIMNRCFMCLHVPFFEPGSGSTAFAFSRKVVVDTALKIWCAACPSSSLRALQPRSAADASERNDFARLTICSSMPVRFTSVQAGALCGLELRAQLEEDRGIGAMPVRRDLLSVMEESRDWLLQFLRVGEPNVKGYVLTAMVICQLHGIMEGLDDDEITRQLMKAAEEAAEYAMGILQEQAGMQGQKQDDTQSSDEALSQQTRDLISEWEMMTTTETLFDFAASEPMGWDLSADQVQGSSLW